MVKTESGDIIPDSLIRKEMEVDDVCLHLLRIWDRNKHVAHWQLIASFALDSLWIDSRISKPVYVKVRDIVSSGKLLEYDNLLTNFKHKQEAKQATKAKPKPVAKKLIRPKSRGLL